MVFSTVQISMPGTSWARAPVHHSMQCAETTEATRAIRLIIKILTAAFSRENAPDQQIARILPQISPQSG
jgi:hypothetical protein